MIETLIKLGVNKDAVNDKEHTALIIAAYQGHTAVVETLLKWEANIEIATSKGFTVLMIAAEKGHAEIVKSLVKWGADTEVVISNGYTALMIAAKRSQVKIVEILTAAGADKEKVDYKGFTALMIAAKEGHAAVVETLVKARADKEKAESHGLTALMIAVTLNHVGVVKTLLAEGVNKEAVERQGWTALIIAARYSNVEVIEALLAAGANKEAVGRQGTTALIIAAEHGQAASVKALLAGGANKDAVINNVLINNGYTALMIAAQKGHVEVIKILIEEGANIEVNIQFSFLNGAVFNFFPRFFNKNFLQPIFKEALDKGNTKVLVNLCRYAHYRAELSRMDEGDSPEERSIVEEFQSFLAEYNSIPELTIDKVEGLNEIQAQKLQIITSNAVTGDDQSINKIIGFLINNKEEVYRKFFAPSEVIKLIASYLGWQKQWSPMLQLEERLQEMQIYKSVNDIAQLIKALGANISFILNKNLNSLQQSFSISDEYMKVIIDKFPSARAEAFKSYPQAKELFDRDADKANQFILLKLIAKTLSYDIAFYSDIDSLIHFSSNGSAVARFKIYETSKGEQLIVKSGIIKGDLANISSQEELGDKQVEDLVLKHSKAEKSCDISKDFIVSMSLEILPYKSYLVQDESFLSHSSSLEKLMKVIMLPQIKIEYISAKQESNFEPLQIKQVQESEPQSQESSKATSYAYIFYKTTIALKALDASVDIFKIVSEPTLEHLNLLVRDAVHLGVMYTGISSYLSLVSAADVFVQAYKGEYIKAFTQVGVAISYMMLPTILGASLAPLYTATVLAYNSYKVADNLYTEYLNYGTPEALLKSNLAYATLESYLELKDLARECLVSAMQIVKQDFELNHNRDSSIQQIASEYNLLDKLCELEPNYSYCVYYE